MKLLIRFLLSLYVFLQAGYEQPGAHPHRDHVSFSPVSLGIFQMGQHPAIRFAPPAIEKSSDKIYATEAEEDDEQNALKKFLEANNYFTTFFSIHASGFLPNYIKKRLSFSKHFSYVSSSRYILFRAIRV